MTSDSNKNLSPATSIDSSLQAKKRVRYVLPKGCVIGGSYCIEKPLGHGGMGEVYLARHMKLDIYRAIKILLPKIAVKNPMFATRFMREAKLAIQLQHPNIINVMDAEYDERLSIYYIVMEYVDGGTVRNLIRKNGPINEQEVLKIVLRVGEALAVGEERKIVHRDIKPDNIMLTKDNIVKLADLGIAKSAADSNDVDVTSPEILIGTPAYVSPEQARDAQHVDSRADIYSLGVSMYEMLTGEKPYKGKTTVEILQQLFEASVPEVRQKNQSVSRKVSDLVYRMMAKEKEKRPRNWRTFCKEVSKLLGEDEVVSSNETATTSIENIKDLLPKNKGIVLGSDENKPLVDRKKVKKAAKYSVFVLLGFAVCFLLISGVLSPNNLAAMRDSIALSLIGKEYREQCKKYQITPPLYLVFSSGALKQAWIDQNKTEEKTQEIAVKPVEENENPVPNDEYKGRGTLEFELIATPEIENWLKAKQYKLEIAAGKYIPKIKVGLPGSLEVPGGKYNLTMSIPECKALPAIEIDLKKDAVQKVKVFVQPVDAVLKIECNVPKFQVWWSNAWLDTNELKVDSLHNIDLVIRAEGYKQFTSALKLQPGEVKSISILLEELPRQKMNTQMMKKADEEFERKNYATAKKLYKREADNGNPAAMYKMGEIYDQGLGEWFADKTRAFRYYRMAADLELPEAIFKVGEFYEHGMGNTAKNEKTALQWYKRGAELNHLPCLVKIGIFYEHGIAGLERNQDTALTYYLRSAEKGNAEAQYRSARIFEQKMLAETIQMKRDEYKKQAKHFYEEASRQNWSDARSRLRSL